MKVYIGNDNDLSTLQGRVSPLVQPIFPSEGQSSSSVQDLSWGKRFDSYLKLSNPILERASLEDADIAILPTDWSFIRGHSWKSRNNKALEDWALEFSQKVESANKQLVTFFIGDRSHEAIALKQSTTFRSGPYKSRNAPTDFAMPAFPEDLLEHFCKGQLSIRSKEKAPTVGFCGLAKPRNSLKDYSVVLAYRAHSLLNQGWLDVSPYKGESLRIKALRLLEQHPNICTNFKVRTHSVFLNNSSASYESKKRVREEYVSNLLNSDYVLCCRGSGNFSIRLYETLCLGRIPVFINTDCTLPYDFKIDWKKFCVWVEEKDLANLGDKISDFHNNLTEEEFINLQYECRKLWEEWLTPEGFMRNLHLHF